MSSDERDDASQSSRGEPLRSAACASTFALDVYWASRGEDGERAENAALDAHIPGCARCREYLAHIDALDAHNPPLRTEAVRPRAASRWFHRATLGVGLGAGALALAAGIALFVKSRAAEERDTYVGLKGTPAVQLLVHRDRDTRIWDGHAPLHPGDALALRVACEGMKRVAVAAPSPGASPSDGRGKGWTRIEESSCDDGEAPLPFTLNVDDAPGDERLAVVLSREALDEETLQSAIAEARRNADLWVVSFVMPKELEKK